MKPLLIFVLSALLLHACSNKEADVCPSSVDLTASSVTPTAGDSLVLHVNTGRIIYNWTGPGNFAEQTADGRESYRFNNVTINQTGWYHVGAGLPGCNTVFDSIYIEVKYPQGNPSCNLTNNLIVGDAVPDLQASSVRKQMHPTYNGIYLYASGSYGYPTYTFLFNSNNGNSEPKDGIYKTTNLPVFNDSYDANAIYLQVQYSSIFFTSQPNQNVYVSHVNGKLRIAICNLKFSGDDGTSNIRTYGFTGQVTEL